MVVSILLCPSNPLNVAKSPSFLRYKSAAVCLKVRTPRLASVTLALTHYVLLKRYTLIQPLCDYRAPLKLYLQSFDCGTFSRALNGFISLIITLWVPSRRERRPLTTTKAERNSCSYCSYTLPKAIQGM